MKSMLRNCILAASALTATCGLFCHATADRDDNAEQQKRNLRAPSSSSGLVQFSDPKSVIPRREYPLSQSSSARRCPSPLTPPNDRWYKSQSGEDRKLMTWFHSLCDGTYIEMGALDGRTFSNSYVFNRGLGWKGVLIELSPENYEKLVVNRPPSNEQAVVNAGVCAEPQALHYFSGVLVDDDADHNYAEGGFKDKRKEATNGAVSGIYEFAAPSFIEMYWKNIPMDDPRVKEIQCDTLDSLLMRHTPDRQYWDFFSLDVEGAEFSVLQSVDFSRVQFGVILVESDEHDVMKNLYVKAFLETKGYVFVEEYARSYWFVNGNFDAIYRELMH